MTAKERILAIRLAEKVQRRPEAARRMGVMDVISKSKSQVKKAEKINSERV